MRCFGVNNEYGLLFNVFCNLAFTKRRLLPLSVSCAERVRPSSLIFCPQLPAFWLPILWCVQQVSLPSSLGQTPAQEAGLLRYYNHLTHVSATVYPHIPTSVPQQRSSMIINASLVGHGRSSTVCNIQQHPDTTTIIHNPPQSVRLHKQ